MAGWDRFPRTRRAAAVGLTFTPDKDRHPVRELWLDLETRSRVDLKKATPYRYAEDPSFSIHMCSWSDDGETIQTALGHEEISDIPYLWSPRTKKIAHNAPFERICLSRLRGLPVGSYLPPEDFHDTQAVAGEYGYPQSLAALAKALNCTPKDTAGTRLINLFCKPNRKGEFNRPEDYPEEWLQFIDYCEQDVETLIEVDQKLGGHITPTEAAVYLADQVINDRGLAIDTELAAAAVEAAADNAMVQEIEFTNLTGVANPNSQPQLMAWCRRVGLPNQDMQAETIEGLLETDLDADVRAALLLRQELALVAAKKFSSALYSVNSDNRLRGSFRYYGAHTARWSGRGAQPQNLPRLTFTNELVSKALKGAASEVDAILTIMDLLETGAATADDLKRLVRAMFLYPDGGTVFDYASIEARVISWFAPEEWALQAFRDGRDIYTETANRMGGLTRDQGKVAVLALGYAGGVNSLRNMGAEGDDDELKRLVYQWRRANPNIVNLWEKMADAMDVGGQVGPHLHIEKQGTTRLLHLPSGRAIHYHDFKWERYRVKLPDGSTKLKESWRYRNPKKGNGPPRIGTYGGRMTENATQAVARDIMAEALVRLIQAGYLPVGHVHDEVLLDGQHDVKPVIEIATQVPTWAAGLPIDAEGFTCKRYRKG